MTALLLALCGVATPGRASFVASDAPPFVSQFQSFLHDYFTWNAQHQNEPMTLLATTPESQRAQALVMEFLLWMRDHANTLSPATTASVPSIASVSNTSPPPIVIISGGGGSIGPPGGGGGGPPGGGGGGPPGGGHSSSNPEPSSLALLGSGGFSLLIARLLRSRRRREN